MTKRVLQGATVGLSNDDGAVRRLLIGSTWADVNVDIDMCALLLQQDSGAFRVPSPDYFLYRNRRATPERAGFLMYLPPGQSMGPDRAQILLNFDELPKRISRVVVAMSALRPGGLVAEQGTLRTRVADLDTGETLYVYQHSGAPLSSACVTLWTLDRAGTQWLGRVTASAYAGGPPALARDYGVRT